MLPDRMDDLERRLRHVVWLGGGSGAGKSTIARRLADAYGLQLYSTDEAMADHGRRCSKIDCPLLAAFQTMTMDERWVHRPPQVMLETFHWFAGEGFDLIIEDLLRLPTERHVIVEGFRLLPRLAQPLLAIAGHGAWLIPTPEFRLAAFESRGGLWDIAGKTSDPFRALRNILERDRLFTERLELEAQHLCLDVIPVDTTMNERELEMRVARSFDLAENLALGRR